MPRTRHARSRTRRRSRLAHHLHDHALATLPVEFRVEHLFPGTEIELPRRDRQHHLMAENSSLQVRVRVVFARLVMPVIETRRGELLEPDLDIADQPALP